MLIGIFSLITVRSFLYKALSRGGQVLLHSNTSISFSHVANA
jgi:hypothetical protein